MSSLLAHLLEEKRSRRSGGLYHKTQVNFAYNSNRIEGSKLVESQIRGGASSKGAWRMARSPVMQKTLTNRVLRGYGHVVPTDLTWQSMIVFNRCMRQDARAVVWEPLRTKSREGPPNPVAVAFFVAPSPNICTICIAARRPMETAKPAKRSLFLAALAGFLAGCAVMYLVRPYGTAPAKPRAMEPRDTVKQTQTKDAGESSEAR